MSNPTPTPPAEPAGRTVMPTLGEMDGENQTSSLLDVTIKVKRYNPDVETKPHWETYQVKAEPTDRVLDVLHKVKWEIDGTLTFRRSCAHGVCGSDAMIINGANGLACVQLIQDIGTKLTVEPIRGLPVIKDLLVDMEPFFAQYR